MPHPPTSARRGVRSTPRPRLLGKLMAALALLAGLLGLGVAWAPVAGAHHANLSATVACPATGAQAYAVDYEASSWATGSQGANSDVRVEYSVDGGSWTTGAELSFPNVPADSPIPSASGSFTVPADADDVLQVRIKAYADWGNGNTSRGPWAVQTLTLPAGCETVVDLPDNFEDTDAEDEGNDDSDCGSYDPADGPVWHFVVNQLAPNTPAGSLTATFGPAPDTVTETVTVAADSVNNSLQDFFVQSTQRYLIDAQATFAGAQPTAKMVLSHVCAGPTVETPVECDDDESGSDTNGNGIPDTCVPNPPCDADETMVDVDGDGIPEACEPNPVECDSDELPLDENGNGIDDACEPNPVECDSDELPLDENGNGITDGCEPNPVECDADELPLDENGNGIADACEPDPVVCDADESAGDADENGIDDTCTPNPPCDADETMVDVDEDGVPESCTEVDGETLTPSVPETPRGEQVLGETVDRQPAAPATQGTALPRTGGDPLPLTSVAIGLVLAGSALTGAGRRRATTA